MALLPRTTERGVSWKRATRVAEALLKTLLLFPQVPNIHSDDAQFRLHAWSRLLWEHIIRFYSLSAVT